jgi:hypothetical protein
MDVDATLQAGLTAARAAAAVSWPKVSIIVTTMRAQQKMMRENCHHHTCTAEDDEGDFETTLHKFLSFL